MTIRSATADCADLAIAERETDASLLQVSNAVDASEPAFEIPAEASAASLRSNFWWMLSGNAVYALCQWGLLAILARLGTPAIVGQYVLAVAVTTPITVFFMLHLRAVQATDTRRDYQFGHYLALRLCAMGLALLTVVGVCLTSGYRGDTFLVIAAVAVSAVCDSMSDIVYGLLQQRERLDRIGQSMMLRGASSVILLAAAIASTGRVFYGILAVACGRLMVLALFDLRSARNELARGASGNRLGKSLLASIASPSIKPRWEPRRILSLARVALPLGVVMMLVVLSTNIPRYFVESYLDQSALGIFGAIGYLSVAGTMAVGALGDSVTPRLARDYAQGRRREFGIYVLRLAGLGAATGSGGRTGLPPGWAAPAGTLVWPGLRRTQRHFNSHDDGGRRRIRRLVLRLRSDGGPLFQGSIAVVRGRSARHGGRLLVAGSDLGTARSRRRPGSLGADAARWFGPHFVLRDSCKPARG